MLNVYRLNDCDAYAGRTMLQALRAAMSDSGLPAHAILDRNRAKKIDQAEWPTFLLNDLNDECNPAKITLAEVMATITEPGLVFTTEY